MYLSPLTWGTYDMCGDFQHHRDTEVKTSRLENFKAKRVSLAKERNEMPKFVALLHEITAVYSPQPYLPNPLAEEACLSRLGKFVERYFCWDSFPLDVDIGIGHNGEGGLLPTSRVKRKRQQLDNIMAFVIPFLQDQDSSSALNKKVVVDFCCGCGHQSIPLAFLFPDVKFVLIDTNRRSLDIARKRVDRLGLGNVQFIEDNIQNFQAPFDVGLSLHACGVATDIAIQKSVQARAVYISIPCCVGKVAHHDSERAERTCGDITYPRSREYVNVGCTLAEYLHIARAADFGHHGFDDATVDEVSEVVGVQKTTCDASSEASQKSAKAEALTDARRLSKRVIEQDRNFYARGHNYVVHMSLCFPTSCTPKNDILVGIPGERHNFISSFEEWTKIIS